MATIPIYNPQLPFLGLIPGVVHHGKMIRVKGQMNSYGDRFYINLQKGPIIQPRDDVCLHLSVRPNQGTIVRNHYFAQNWGPEERYGGCPIAMGQYFDILILAETACWKVAINGIHYCTFNHRLQMNEARFINVDGDCTIHSITTENDYGPAYPTAPSTNAVPPVINVVVPPPPPPPSYNIYPNVPHHHSPHHNPHHYPPSHHGGPQYPPHHGHPHHHVAPVHPPIGTMGHPTPVVYMPDEKKKKKKKALKYAAVAGGVGLGALAIGSMLSGDGGDCCDD